jgi:hypothetical protein
MHPYSPYVGEISEEKVSSKQKAGPTVRMTVALNRLVK